MWKKIPRATQNSRENDWNTTPRTSSDTVGQVMEISHDKLPPMPKKSASMFHHNFYPKWKIDLKDTKILQETRHKLVLLQQSYDDIVSKHSSDIGPTHLEEMKLTWAQMYPCCKQALPLKHHKFVKEEIKNLLEAGLIERSMSPYATSVIVVHRKSNLGAPLTETKRLVIDYCELNKQIPKVQTTKAKSVGSLALIETNEIDHIWSKLKGAKYFSILGICSWYHISIHPDSRPKTIFTCPYGKLLWKRVAFGVQTVPSIFLNLMFKLFFKYLNK